MQRIETRPKEREGGMHPKIELVVLVIISYVPFFFNQQTGSASKIHAHEKRRGACCNPNSKHITMTTKSSSRET